MPDAGGSGTVDRELAQLAIARDRTQHYRWKRGRHRLSRAWRPIHRPRYRQPCHPCRTSRQRWRGAGRADAVGPSVRGGARVDETAGRCLGEDRVRLAASSPSTSAASARRLPCPLRFCRPAYRSKCNEGNPRGYARRLGDGRAKRTCTDLAARGPVNGGHDDQHHAFHDGCGRRDAGTQVGRRRQGARPRDAHFAGDRRLCRWLRPGGDMRGGNRP
jgi:hypothetical protein